MAKKDPKEVIEGEVVSVLTMQQELDSVEAELMAFEPFQRFTELRRAVANKEAEIRKAVSEVMIPAYIAGEVDKTVKGDWGSVTVTESDKFDIDEAALPAKFWKKVPDTTRIRATYQLEGKEPKGTKQTKQYGIMIKFK